MTFEGEEGLGAVGGRVARTVVAALNQDGSLRYHVGIVFSAPIPLQAPAAPTVAADSAVAGPTAEPARQDQIAPRNRW